MKKLKNNSLDLDFIKQYLQVDFDDDDALIEFFWRAAKDRVETLTHRKLDEWENLPYDVVMARLLLTQNFYDKRSVEHISPKLQSTVVELIKPYYVYGEHWKLPEKEGE